MQIAGIGRVIFWDGGSLWIGLSVTPVELHAHHAIQIGFGLSAPVQFKPTAAGSWGHYPAAVIPSNLPHLFQSPGNQIAFLFAEPESLAGGQILQRFGRHAIAGLEEAEARRLSAPLARMYSEGADDEDLTAAAQQVLATLAGNAAAAAPAADPRILTATSEIMRRLDEPLTLAEVARVAGLSEGRFRHLFVAETGVSFRAYVLWARLRRALELGFGGTSWTEAAHAANFADSAHLTRTCRRMMGIAPTAIRQDYAFQSDRMLA